MEKELIGQGIPFDPIDSIEDPVKPSKEPKTPTNEPVDIKPPKKGSPIIVVLLVVFLVAALTGAGVLYFARDKEIQERVKVEEQLAGLVQEKIDLQQELDDVSLVKQQLQEDLDQSRINLANLLADYQQEKSEHDKLTAKYQQNMRLVSDLKAKLAKEENISVKMSTKLIKVSQEYNEIKAQLRQIRMAKEALENKILNMTRKQNTSGVQLDKIVVNSGQSPAPAVSFSSVQPAAEKPMFAPLGPPARLEGQVLVVNKEFAFVVVNLGQKDGINNADVLNVYRGQELLGQVQVERIYDTMSSAVILPKVTKTEIKEGDIVKLM